MDFKKSLISVGIFLFLITINGIVLYNWVSVDNRPTAWDESIHTRLVYDYKDRISNEGFFSILKPAYFNYPPLYHLMLGPLINIPDDVADAGPLLNFFFLILLMLGVFLIADRMFGRWQAFTASFLISLYPIINQLLIINMIDLALTAGVTLCMYFLLRSEDFSNLKWSINFGVTLGFSMLLKWTALAYVLFPLIYSAYLAIRRKDMKPILASMGVCILIAAPWYLINLIPALSRISHGAAMQPASGILLGKIMNWFWYGFALFPQLSFIFVLLFLPGLVAVYWKPKLLPLFLWFIGSLIIFTIFTNRNLRYTMPALPAVALLSVAWIPIFRKGTLICLNVVMAIYFIMMHWVPGDAIEIEKAGFKIPFVMRLPASSADWQHENVINEILQKKTDKPFTRVLCVSNAPYFHSTSLNVSLRKRKITDFAFRGPSKRRFLEFADFVLLKTGNLGPGYTVGRVAKVAEFIQNPPDWFDEVYREINRWPLPDGTEAILYQTNPKPVKLAQTGLFNLDLDEMELPRIVARHVKIRAIPSENLDIQQGFLDKMTIQVEKLQYKKFEFQNIVIELDEPQINIPLFLETQEIQLLSLVKLSMRGEALMGPLKAYAQRKAKWLADPQLIFENDDVLVSAKAYGIPIQARAQIEIESGQLRTRMKRIKILHIPIPLFMLRSVTDHVVDLQPNRESPFIIDVNGFEGSDGKVKIL